MRLCQNAGTASIIRLVICVLNIDNITDKYDLCFYYQLIEICYYEKENYVRLGGIRHGGSLGRIYEEHCQGRPVRNDPGQCGCIGRV